MKVSVFASDLLSAEALACLISCSSANEVVGCFTNLGSIPAETLTDPECALVVAEEVVDGEGLNAIRSAAPLQNVATILLAWNEIEPDVLALFDYVVNRRTGAGTLFHALAAAETRFGAVRSIPRLATEPPSGQDADADPLAKIRSAKVKETGRLVARGHTNLEIGDLIGVSENCVKAYVFRLMKHCACSNRTRLALLLAGKAESRPRLF